MGVDKDVDGHGVRASESIRGQTGDHVPHFLWHLEDR